MRSTNEYLNERQVPTEQEIEVFLFLLRTSLWGSAADDRQVPDLSQVRMAALWQLAKEQTVEGLIAESLQKLYKYKDVSDASALPDFLKLGMQMSYQHQHLNDTIVFLFDYLKKKDFFPILLKGQGNAARYPNPFLRQCGDIDIYIGKKDYERACKDVAELAGKEALLKAGLTNKHLHFSYDRLPIEYHRIAERLPNPIANRRFQAFTEYWLTPERCNQVQINNHQISVPNRQFNVVYVFNHTWHHFIAGGIGVRQVCDWCMLLHEAAGKIDIAQLEKDLKQLHLLKQWQILGYIAVNKLGLPQDEMPLANNDCGEKAERTWQMIISGGNFGNFSASRNHSGVKNIIIYKLISLKCHAHHLSSLYAISKEDAIWGAWFVLHDGLIDVYKKLSKGKFTK